MSAPLLTVRGLSKAYGGVQALSEVSLEIGSSEVLALCGENGAGKSTLNKILSGSVVPDSGEALIEERPLAFGSVRAMERAGIAILHQEAVDFPHLTAAENIFLLREPAGIGGFWLDKAEMNHRTKELLASLGESFPVDRPLEELTLVQRRMTGVARALSLECRLLILDEPTASLSARETESLFRVMRNLRRDGISVLYVSHRLEEVFELADRAAVLRDGRLVAVRPAAELSQEELVGLMVGREVLAVDRERREPGREILRVDGLSRAGSLRDVSFALKEGEIVGLAGLVGAGRSEAARAIFGLDPFDSGTIRIDGELLPMSRPAEAIRRGLAYLPEDRQHEGLHLPMSVRENTAMARLRGGLRLVDRAEEGRVAQGQAQEIGIRAASIESRADSLSGGNQQKTLLAKWLVTKPKALILDEPTRGVDVGAKADVHRLIAKLADDGAAILLISSELPEVLALSDRVLVMRQGEIAGELKGPSGQDVLELALPKEERAAARDSKRRIMFGREATLAILLIALMGVVGLVNPSFLALENLRDLLVKAAPAVIVGCGLTFVILAREIDISVGSMMGLCAAGMGWAGTAGGLGGPVWIGVLFCLGIGIAAGTGNGLLVAKGRIPSIIVTLGTLTILSGTTELLLQGKWIQGMPADLRAFGTGNWAGVPYSVWAAALTVAASHWLARRTPFGRRVAALGSSPESAHWVGLPAARLRLAVFTLTGLLAGVAALFSATQLEVIEAGFGRGFELAAVAAVVVGGTSIRGGTGTILGTVLGAFLLSSIGTMLIFLRLEGSSIYWERAIQGALILAAILADFASKRKAK